MTSDCPHVVNGTRPCLLSYRTYVKVKRCVLLCVCENASGQPAVLLKTSEAAGLSEMMAVASPVAVRSKVSVPEVVS